MFSVILRQDSKKKTGNHPTCMFAFVHNAAPHMRNNDNGQATTIVEDGQQWRHHQQQATIN
jgi:hypothetical protein